MPHLVVRGHILYAFEKYNIFGIVRYKIISILGTIDYVQLITVNLNLHASLPENIYIQDYTLTDFTNRYSGHW